MKMSLDKNGNEYTPMTEAERAAHRARPYPEDFIRTSQMLEMRAAQRAKEAPREYHEPEVRRVSEPIQKTRHVNARKGK